jgi:hypothetical protein
MRFYALLSGHRFVLDTDALGGAFGDIEQPRGGYRPPGRSQTNWGGGVQKHQGAFMQKKSISAGQFCSPLFFWKGGHDLFHCFFSA